MTRRAEQEPQGHDSTQAQELGDIKITRRDFLRVALGGTLAVLTNPSIATAQDDDHHLVSPTATPEPQALLSKADTGIEKNVNKETKLPGALIALSHIAGGEFMDEASKEAIEGRIFQMPNGTVVYLDNDTLGAVTTELDMGKGIKNPSADQRMELAMAKWDILNHLTGDKSTDFAVLTEKGIFAFHGSNEPVDIISKEGVNTISFSKTRWFIPKVEYDVATNSFVGTDGYRIMHRYDPVARNLVELEDYTLLGTPEQRIRKNLADFLELVVKDGDQEFKNPLGLDPNEVARYLETGNSDGFKTFEVINDAEGKPAFILVKNGSPTGLNEHVAEIAKAAFARINEVDPEMATKLVKMGLRVFTFDPPPKDFDHLNYCSTFENGLGFVELNQNTCAGLPVSGMVAVIIGETRGIHDEQHLDNGVFILPYDQLSSNIQADKAMYTRRFAEVNPKLSPEEKDYIISWMNDNIPSTASAET